MSSSYRFELCFNQVKTSDDQLSNLAQYLVEIAFKEKRCYLRALLLAANAMANRKINKEKVFLTDELK